MQKLKDWVNNLIVGIKIYLGKIKDYLDDKRDIVWAVGISVALYFLMNLLQRNIGMGSIDFVVLLKPIYAAICLFIGSSAIWLLLKISWKTIAKYYKFNEFFEDWKRLDPLYRIIVSSVIWLSYLYFFVQIVLGGIGTWMN